MFCRFWMHLPYYYIWVLGGIFIKMWSRVQSKLQSHIQVTSDIVSLTIGVEVLISQTLYTSGPHTQCAVTQWCATLWLQDRLKDGVSDMRFLSVGESSSWETRPMDLSLCHGPPPTSTFCTCWRTFSQTPSRVGSPMRLCHQRRATNPLSLINRWLLCCGSEWSLGFTRVLIYSVNRSESGWGPKMTDFCNLLLVVSTEEAQLASNQLCGAGAGCR